MTNGNESPEKTTTTIEVDKELFLKFKALCVLRELKISSEIERRGGLTLPRATPTRRGFLTISTMKNQRVPRHSRGTALTAQRKTQRVSFLSIPAKLIS